MSSHQIPFLFQVGESVSVACNTGFLVDIILDWIFSSFTTTTSFFFFFFFYYYRRVPPPPGDNNLILLRWVCSALISFVGTAFLCRPFICPVTTPPSFLVDPRVVQVRFLSGCPSLSAAAFVSMQAVEREAPCEWAGTADGSDFRLLLQFYSHPSDVAPHSRSWPGAWGPCEVCMGFIRRLTDFEDGSLACSPFHFYGPSQGSVHIVRFFFK